MTPAGAAFVSAVMASGATRLDGAADPRSTFVGGLAFALS